MTDQSMLDNNTTLPTVAPTNPHEIALQSLCKQLLKSRLFRGFYLERRYVDAIKDYRDLVCLQKSEKSLEKMLRDIRDKILLFYSHQNPHMWIGITSGSLTDISNPTPAGLETYLWVELKDSAFIEYWFSIKSIRFRANEIIIKLKVVQPVEQEDTTKRCDKNQDPKDAFTDFSKPNPNTFSASEKHVTFDDFVSLLQQWGISIKQTLYLFLAEDISKENIKGVLRFVGLLLVSLISAAFMGLKFLGIFTLRFMLEISRLTHVLTPIIIKIIEMLNKIIGGFYILLAMIWKDAVVNRNQPKHQALEHNRPIYNSIQYEVEYEVKQRRHEESSPGTVTSCI